MVGHRPLEASIGVRVPDRQLGAQRRAAGQGRERRRLRSRLRSNRSRVGVEQILLYKIMGDRVPDLPI